MDAAFCTIIAKNYLAYARVLSRSLRRHHPGVPFYVLLVDEPDGLFDPEAEPFTVVRLHELGLPRPREFCFRYDVLELSTAVKPYLLEHLFARGHGRIVFLDPDIQLYRPLTTILDERQPWRMVLTPHVTAPLDDGKRPGEREILLSGVYNLGFLALTRDAGIDAFLGWWKDRCEHDCVVDPALGLFVDQRWMDFLPGMMDRVLVLRDATYNVAYWNLPHRRLEGPPDAPLVNGSPLHFFHFSGLDPLRPTLLSRHQDRYETVTDEPLLGMLHDYSSALLQADYRACSRWPYTHATFTDGHPIGREMRELLREQRPGRFPDPFQTDGTDSFLAWAIAPSRESSLSPLAERIHRWWKRADRPPDTRRLVDRLPVMTARTMRRLMGAGRRFKSKGYSASPPPLAPIASRILARRPDVRDACSTRAGTLDRSRFLQWLAADGVVQHQLKPAWCNRWVAEAGEQRIMPWLLATYDARPDLQLRYPLAFVEEHDASALNGWIEDNRDALGLDADRLGRVRKLFAEEPTRRIAKIYSSRPDVQRAFPEGLDWPGDPTFLAWLRHSGREEYGVSEDWVLWFERSREQHVCRRIHQLYRTRPDWQERHPHAFSPFGRRSFLAWLKNGEGGALGLELSSVQALCAPRSYSALEELRAFYQTVPTIRHRFPRAFRRVADTERLLAWLRDEGRVQFHLEDDWLDRLAREARTEGMVSRGALVVGYLRTESGMGELARATVRALTAAHYPVATLSLDETPQRKADLTVPLDDASDPLPFTIVHVNGPEATRLRDRFSDRRSAHRIGYWAWELSSLPPEWLDAFALFEEVWTCSRYSAAAIAASSPMPVLAFWPALPDAVPDRVDRCDLGLDAEEFTFLFIYDLFSETDRKNPLGLIDAFREAFRSDDRVRLVIKAANADLHRDDFRQVVDAARGLRVTVLDRYLSRAGVLGLIQACDAYVSLHRAEGFGFTLAEAMSLGKPVVATYYSGNVDFMSPWNSFPVPYRLLAIPDSRGPYPKGGLWAEPDIGAAAILLRKVYREREHALEVAARGQADVLRMLSPRACGQRIAERLAVLAGTGSERRTPGPAAETSP